MLRGTYFAILDKMKEKYPDAMFISVARKTPKKAPVDEILLPLAPSKELFNAYKNGLSEEEYTKWFKRDIENSKEAQIHMKILINLSKHTDVFLVCWEKTGKFCHRNILIEMMGYKQSTFDNF